MSTAPQNIFQTVSQQLAPLTSSLAQDAAYNRQQRESLIATKIVNEFQGKMSQHLIDQKINFDGTYDPDSVNQELFNSESNGALANIKSEKIRTLVQKGFSDYRLHYETASKLQGLELEGELQVKLANDNLSNDIGLINLNPAEYENVIAKFAKDSQAYRPDLKDKLTRAYLNEVNSNYLQSQYNAYENDYIENKTIKSAEDFANKIKELQIKANSSDFYLDANQRTVSNHFLNEKLQTRLAAAASTRRLIAEQQFKAIVEATSKGVPPPQGLDIESISNTAAGDNPVALQSNSLALATAAIEGGTRNTIQAYGFHAAQAQLINLQDEMGAAYSSGHTQEANEISNTITATKKVIDTEREIFKKNTAEYLLYSSIPSLEHDKLLIAYNTPENVPMGKRNYDSYVSDVFRMSYMMEQDKSNIKFLPVDKVNEYKDILQGITTSGDKQQFLAFAAALRHDWGGKNHLAGGIDVYESVINQLNETDSEGKTKSLTTALALKHTLINPDNAGMMFELLTSRNNGERWGVPVGIKDDSPEKVEAAVKKVLMPYYKAFEVYPAFLSGQSPGQNYETALIEMVSNSRNYFPQAKSLDEVAKKLAEKTIAKEFKIVMSGAASNPVAIPVVQTSSAVETFVASRLMQTLYLKELQTGAATQTEMQKAGKDSTVFKPLPVSIFNDANLPGLLVKGNINPADISRAEGDKVFYRLEAFAHKEEGQTGVALIPFIVNGQRVSKEDAIQNYRKTNDHLGVFSNEANAKSFLERLRKHQSDVEMGRTVDPSQAEFTTPQRQQIENKFGVDKDGYVKGLRFAEDGGRMMKLKGSHLLTNGHFVPIDGGERYALYANFTKYDKPMALILDHLDENNKPIQYTIDKVDIENNIYPRFAKHLIRTEQNYTYPAGPLIQE